ncbi:yteA family sporulation protein [Pseudogracilibacillus sp. SE30717A]|uniref:TraR/DksA C4-type zinc finger protein n=1 Tax=Pseudogracilibacillus sp. SE30717A TaxID=3098293 RepID=UPI00300E5E52
MLTNEQTNELKEILLTRQSQMIRQVQDRFGLETSFTDAVGELSSYDNHPGDMGTEMYEREKDIALNEHAERELEEINEALHAIDEGTYGICKVCSLDIAYDRLKAVPTADTCREHAEDDERIFKRNRPVEEEVYSPNINPDEVTAETQVGYDAEDAWQEVSRYGTSETPSDFFGDRDSYNEMYPNSDEDVGYVEDVERYSSHD